MIRTLDDYRTTYLADTSVAFGFSEYLNVASGRILEMRFQGEIITEDGYIHVYSVRQDGYNAISKIYVWTLFGDNKSQSGKLILVSLDEIFQLQRLLPTKNPFPTFDF